MTSAPTLAAIPSFASFTWYTSKRGRWLAALSLPLVVGPLWCLAGQTTSNILGTLAGFVLLAALAMSAVTDIRSHKIYNWVTYSAFLWALLINIAASLLATDQDFPTRAVAAGPDMLGGVGIGQCLVGAALCFTITLLGYRLSGIGAGDVKLATVIGAVLGIQQGVYSVIYAYVVAAVAIIVWSAWTNGPLTLLKAGLRTVGALFGFLWPFQPTADDHQLLMQPVPLGPYFAIGTLLIVLEIVPS